MDLLDAIVSAVSEVMLVFEDAQRNVSTVVAMPLANFGLLVQEIGRMVSVQAGQSNRIEDPLMRAAMEQVNEELRAETMALENTVKTSAPVVRDSYHIPRHAYKPLHDHLKNIIIGMIKQTQMVDQFNVDLMMKIVKIVLDLYNRLKVAKVEQLDVIIADLNNRHETFKVFMNHRLNEVSNYEMKERMAKGISFFEAARHVVKDICLNAAMGSEEGKDRKEDFFGELIQAAQDILFGIKESARIVKEFSLLFELPPAPEGEAHVAMALSLLKSCLVMGDKEGAFDEVLRQMQLQLANGRVLAGKLTDQKQKAILERNLEELERVMGSLTVAMKRLEQNPGDILLIDEIEKLIDEASLINDRIEAMEKTDRAMAINALEIKSLLHQMSVAAQKADLSSLDTITAKLIAKRAEQMEIMAKLAASSKSMDASSINRSAERMESSIEAAMSSARYLAAAAGDYERLRRAMEDEARAREGADASNRAVIEALLRENRIVIGEKYDNLQRAIAEGDAKEIKSAGIQVKDALYRQAQLGTSLKHVLPSDQWKVQVGSAVSDLTRSLNELDDVALQLDTQKLNQLNALMDRITASKLFLHKPETSSLTAEDDVKQAAARLISAHRKGHPADINDAERDLMQAVRAQIDAAKKNIIFFPDSKDELISAMLALGETMKHLHDKDGTFEERVAKVTGASGELNDLLLMDALQSNHKKLSELSETLRSTPDDLQKCTDLTVEIQALSERQTDLLCTLGDRREDPRLIRASEVIRQAADDLKNHSFEMQENPSKRSDCVEDTDKIVGASGEVLNDMISQYWNALLRHTERMRQATLSDNDTEMKSASKQAAHAAQKLSQLAAVAASQLKDEELKRSALLMKSHGKSLNETVLPRGDQQRQKTSDLIDSSRSTSDQIFSKLAKNDHKGLIEADKKMIAHDQVFSDTMAAMRAAADRKEMDKMTASARNLVGISKQYPNIAREIDLQRAGNQPVSTASKEDSVPALIRALKSVMVNPNDIEAKRSLEQAVRDATSVHQKATRDMIEEQIRDNESNIEKSMNEVEEAAANGEQSRLDQAIAQNYSDVALHLALGELLTSVLQKEKEREQIRVACKHLEEKRIEAALRAHQMLEKPNDSNERSLTVAGQALKEAAGRVNASYRFVKDVERPEEDFISNHREISSYVQKEDLADARDNVLDAARDQLLLLNGLPIKIDDHIVDDLQRAIDDLDREASESMRRHNELRRFTARENLEKVLAADAALVDAIILHRMEKMHKKIDRIDQLGQTNSWGDDADFILKSGEEQCVLAAKLSVAEDLSLQRDHLQNQVDGSQMSVMIVDGPGTELEKEATNSLKEIVEASKSLLETAFRKHRNEPEPMPSIDKSREAIERGLSVRNAKSSSNNAKDALEKMIIAAREQVRHAQEQRDERLSEDIHQLMEAISEAEAALASGSGGIELKRERLMERTEEKMREKMGLMEEASDRLVAAMLSSDMRDNAREMEEKRKELEEKLHKGDKSTEMAADALAKGAQKQSLLAQSLHDHLKSSPSHVSKDKIFDRLTDAISDLEQYAILSSQAKAAVQNPTQENKEKAENSAKSLVDAAHRAASAADSDLQRIIQSQAELEAAADAFHSANDSDSLQRLTGAVDRYLDNYNDPDTKELREISKKLMDLPHNAKGGREGGEVVAMILKEASKELAGEKLKEEMRDNVEKMRKKNVEIDDAIKRRDVGQAKASTNAQNRLVDRQSELGRKLADLHRNEKPVYNGPDATLSELSDRFRQLKERRANLLDAIDRLEDKKSNHSQHVDRCLKNPSASHRDDESPLDLIVAAAAVPMSLSEPEDTIYQTGLVVERQEDDIGRGGRDDVDRLLENALQQANLAGKLPNKEENSKIKNEATKLKQSVVDARKAANQGQDGQKTADAVEKLLQVVAKSRDLSDVTLEKQLTKNARDIKDQTEKNLSLDPANKSDQEKNAKKVNSLCDRQVDLGRKLARNPATTRPAVVDEASELDKLFKKRAARREEIVNAIQDMEDVKKKYDQVSKGGTRSDAAKKEGNKLYEAALAIPLAQAPSGGEETVKRVADRIRKKIEEDREEETQGDAKARAKDIQDNSQKLKNIVQELSSSRDPQQKKRIKGKVENLNQASAAAVTALSDGQEKGEKEKKMNKLSDAVNLLEGSIIQSIVDEQKPTLKERLNQLSRNYEQGDGVKSKREVDAIKEDAEQLKQKAKKLSQLTDDPFIAQQIKEAIDVIDREMKNVEEQVKKAHGKPVGSENSKMKDRLDKIADAIDRIDMDHHLSSDKNRPEKEIIYNASRLPDVLASPENSQKTSEQHSRRQKAIADRIAESSPNPARSNAIRQAAEAALTSSLNSEGREDRLKKESELVKAVVDECMEKNNEQMNKKKDEVIQNLKSGGRAPEILEDLEASVQRQAELYKELAERSEEGEKQDRMEETSDVLSMLAPKITAARNGKTHEERVEKVKTVMQQVKYAQEASKKDPVDEDTMTFDDFCFDLMNRNNLLGSHLQNLFHLDRNRTDKQIEKDSEKARQEMSGIATSAKKLAAKTSDKKLQQQLNEASQQLNDLAPQIAAATRAAMKDPSNREKREQLQDLTTKAAIASTLIGVATEKIQSDQLIAKEPPKPPANLVVAAAEAVAEEAEVEAINVQHKTFLEIIRAMAAQIKMMGTAKNKSEMIQCARTIAAMIDQVEKVSAEMANACPDARFKNQLLGTSKVPKNYSIQLKIIAAVKSETGNDDYSAKSQLTICAQGLCDATIRTARAAEAAALKTPKA
ncbi:Protein TTN-1, isoform d [Planoprotostelium fungivorum]|uniref:Protein TTN-1, isoform d n=1 Tax=Planoprotostelium fungivorum TaxID=1890364 RepID=A0A2P6MSE9_9EUKA|nr:Protein TTN-1, isoform d [Planoprotostelium fungivorum]